MIHFYFRFLIVLFVIFLFIRPANSTFLSFLDSQDYQISGVISDPDGYPLHDIKVALLNTGGEILESTGTNEAGVYHVSHMTTSAYPGREKVDSSPIALGAAYPNPVGNISGRTALLTHIPVKVNEEGHYNIDVYSVNGQLIKRSSHDFTRGLHTINMGLPQATGVYLVRIQGENVHEVTRITSFGGKGLSVNVSSGSMLYFRQKADSKNASLESDQEGITMKIFGGDEFHDYTNWFDQPGSYEYDITLEYRFPRYNLETKAVPETAGTIEPSGGTYNQREVEVRAVSNHKWRFVRWEGDLSGSKNPQIMSINDDKNIIAVFEEYEPSLWLTWEEIDSLPLSGSAFINTVNVANLNERANLSDQNSQHNTQTFAQALLCARDVNPEIYCSRAEQGIKDAMGTEAGGRTLALGRNLAAYVIAADLIGYREDTFMTWLDEVRHMTLENRTLISTHEIRPNNWGTVSGASRIAASAYIGDFEDVEAAAQVFHGYLGNREEYADFNYGELDWQADPDAPVGINPPGSTIDGRNVDGVLPEEMRRVGDGSFHWPPGKTNYTWGGLQGAVLQAEMLYRLGYPAWEWESQALLRAVNWLHDTVFDDGINDPADGVQYWQPWLINHVYGTDFPAGSASRVGRMIGHTDWTHSGRTQHDKR